MTETPSETEQNRAPKPRHWHPLAALAVTVLVLSLGVAVTISVTTMLLPVIADIDWVFDPVQLNRVADAKFLIAGFIGLFVAQCVSVAVILLLARQRKGKPRYTLFLTAPGSWLSLVFSALAFTIGATALIFGIHALWPFDLTGAMRDFILVAQSTQWLIAILVLAVGAPLSEELLFRGFLLSALERSILGPIGAAILTSALWTVIHWGYAVQAMLALFIMGLALAALVYRTGSIWHAIVAHATYNAGAFAYYRWFVTLN